MRQIALFVWLLCGLGCLPKAGVVPRLQGASIGLEMPDASEEVRQALVARLAAHEGTTSTEKATLKIALHAQSFSQIQGRYRWVITGSMHLELGEVREGLAFSFPVFLNHPHEREEAAMLAAMPMLERRVEQLLRQGPFELD